jgi:glycosyltransferase involved in cell wall biosynthesis
MVMVEALSKGLPLVSFDCPRGPGDLIEDGYNARLVPDGHIDGLTDALRQLVQDDEARFLMGRNALASAHPYTIDRIAERWEQLFEELLDRRRHSPGVSK